MRHGRGFTLVEVLVALLVLALALTAWQWRITAQVDNSTHLRDKVLAQLVADNQLRYLQLAARTQSGAVSLQQSGTVLLAGRRWHWVAKQSVLTPAATATGASTLEQGVMLLDVAVSENSLEAASDQPLATLTGVLDARPL